MGHLNMSSFFNAKKGLLLLLPGPFLLVGRAEVPLRAKRGSAVVVMVTPIVKFVVER